MADKLTDARGVEISPGDTVIYGFGVGRAIAMAEGVVLPEGDGVSLTPSGRVRVRIVRRSYSQGEKRVVDVQADRLVVLKPIGVGTRAMSRLPVLPESPLPTQDDQARLAFERLVERYEENLRATEPPSYWNDDLDSYQEFCRHRLDVLRGKLEAFHG